MVEITREGLFTLDSTIVHKVVFHCLPYTHPPPYTFIGVIYMSVCLSVCLSFCLSVCLSVLCCCVNRQSLYLQGYMCTYILFFIDLTFIFVPFTSSFMFCLLCFVFRKGSFLYCLLPFAFSLSAYYFCLLCLNFCILYFGFGFLHASCMIKSLGISVPLKFWQQTNIHTYRQTDRQMIAYRIWEGGGKRFIERYVLHLMPSNF